MSNDEKFSYLYKKYSGYLKNLCYQYTKNADEAEDCMQDAFIKIYNNLDSVDLNSCKSFISTITKNNTIDYLRKMKKSKYNENIDDCYTDLSSYTYETDEVQYNDIKLFIRDNIEKIGITNYKIFHMYVYENLKHKEIAAKLNMNLNTVRVNYMKAKQNIKKLIENELKE